MRKVEEERRKWGERGDEERMKEEEADRGKGERKSERE